MHIFHLSLLGCIWTFQRCFLLLLKSFPREAQMMSSALDCFLLVTLKNWQHDTWYSESTRSDWTPRWLIVYKHIESLITMSQLGEKFFAYAESTRSDQNFIWANIKKQINIAGSRWGYKKVHSRCKNRFQNLARLRHAHSTFFWLYHLPDSNVYVSFTRVTVSMSCAMVPCNLFFKINSSSGVGCIQGTATWPTRWWPSRRSGSRRRRAPPSLL